MEYSIANFRNSIANFDIDGLVVERDKLEKALSNMILSNELMLKLAIVDTMIKEKLEKENGSK